MALRLAPLSMKSFRPLVLFSGLVAVISAAEPATGSDPAPAGGPPRQLDRVTVEAARYKRVPPPEVPRFMLGLMLFPLNFSFGWPEMMERYVVTASRIPQAPERIAAAVRVLESGAGQQTPAITLDGALRSLPGFSLFRRSDSLTAHPTTQGVSLRGLGPSGASRSLVLYDGVPLNDPFGGWVAWTKVPREGLFRTEVVSGGGATAWGNAALGGVVQVFALPLRTSMVVLDEPPKPVAVGYQGSARLAITMGDFGTRGTEFAVTLPAQREIVQLLGRVFSTDGHAVVAPERRGPIDVPAWSRHHWFQGRWRHAVARKIDLTASVRGYEEKRGNGTPYTQNGSRERTVSLGLTAQPAENFAWRSLAFAQDQSFASTFSSVNATRTAETPASDQFAVPATALGASWTGLWRHDATARTTAGADLRTVRGETREDFAFTTGRFTRRRVAGGRQLFSGLFGLHERPIAPALWLTVGGRLDSWHEADGHRTETERDTGFSLRDDRHAGQHGTEVSWNAGLAWVPAKPWRIRASAQRAFRRPTLNELYRPFRQGANVTEANPGLRTEHVTSGETGVEWTFSRSAVPAAPETGTRTRSPSGGYETITSRAVRPTGTPGALLTLSASAFWHDLRDAVGNVTIARGPGTFPIIGALAAGGLGRQRLNLDRTRVQGVELSAKWSPSPALTVNGDVVFNDATVRRAAVSRGIEGRRVAQVPRRSATLGATWRALGSITVIPRVRIVGRQYEDDENQLTLGAAAVADLGLSRPLTKKTEVFLTVENLGDARLETGRSADGVVNLGTPRLFVAGVRGSW